MGGGGGGGTFKTDYFLRGLSKSWYFVGIVRIGVRTFS